MKYEWLRPSDYGSNSPRKVALQNCETARRLAGLTYTGSRMAGDEVFNAVDRQLRSTSGQRE